MSRSDLSTAILAHAGWAFLPPLATSFIQRFYYRLTVRAGSPQPQPGQPLHAKDRRRIHILVLSLYLLYTVLQTLHDIQLVGDFYSDLGVTPASSDRQIKSQFRRLAARFHPDKLHGVSSGGSGHQVEDGAFVHLKLAHDTLLDPAKRFAYDRFGPSIVRLQRLGLETIPDYVYGGLRSLAPQYLQSGGVLLLLNWLWLPRWGLFWRYLVLLALASLELYFLTHPWAFEPSRAASMWPAILWPAWLEQDEMWTLLPFQLLTLARRVSMSLNIFISQLAPPPKSGGRPLGPQLQQQEQQLQQQITHLSKLAQRTDSEATNLLNLQLAPFEAGKRSAARNGRTVGAEDDITGEYNHGKDHRSEVAREKTNTQHPRRDQDSQLIGTLRDRMVDGVVATAIKAHPDVKKALDRATTVKRQPWTVSDVADQ